MITIDPMLKLMRSIAHAVAVLGTLLAIQTACAQVDTAEVKRAVTDGLQIVQAAAGNYPNHRDCFSCHHQTLPMLAMDLAGHEGVPVDGELLKLQAEFT